MTRLRWKKNPRGPGMSSASSGPLGSRLHDGTTEYASVSALRRAFLCVGWYWVAFGVGEYKNTCNEPCAEEAEAKAQAMAFVKRKLAEASEQSK